MEEQRDFMKERGDRSIADNSVAIVGMAGRFPGAGDISAFWRNLRDGVESISFFTADELIGAGVDPASLEDPNYVKASGVLSGIELFDAQFFGYSPGEAATMDPQHRLFLESAWEAMEDAGCDAERYRGLIGVYAGASMNTYLYNNLQADRGLLKAGGGYHVMVASDKDFLATKVSYKLNLRGPSVTVQTACSTSLVAVHLACQGLRSGECDVALAGGVSVRVPQRVGYVYQEGIILSPDGHCRAFDAGAGGTVIGNGVGIVVLKMLSDAIADGDRVYAVIRGSTINNDGSLKAGYTAPSQEAQAAAISEALGVAGVEAGTIGYVEAHGTGTVMGDPIEIAALTEAFRADTEERGFCAIGSVKTNIGHLDAAAGVAGLIKAAQALAHGRIPPSLNYEAPNPRIDFENSPFYVNTRLSEWRTNGGPRRAGVSSFGIGGTNAHAVLEEAPDVGPSGPSRPRQLVVLSARTESALEAQTANLVEHLGQHPDLELADVAYTLQVGRKRMEHRRFLVCRGVEDAKEALGRLEAGRVLGSVEEAGERPVVFMFSGQGAQYVDMGVGLYRSEAVFREAVDGCCELLEPHLGFDLREVLYPSVGQGQAPSDEQIEGAVERLGQTAVTQPALFVIEYALARLWQAWGLRPRAMIGHSIGEYTAACLAGVFSLEDGLALVAARGQLMQQMAGGGMLSVPLSEGEVQPLLGEGLSIGVINGPARCVVSGSTEAIEVLESRLARREVVCRRLHTSHAFHSAMMEPIVERFVERVRSVTLQAPQIPCISNVTGTWLTDAEATEPGYWGRHLRQTVRFSEGVGRLMEEGEQVLLEVGPGRMLTTLATQHPGKAAEQVVLSSLRHPQDAQSDEAFLLNTLGKLWLVGAEVEWAGFYARERRLRVSLPTYPFERQRHWIEPGGQDSSREQAAQTRQRVVGGRSADVAEWFYVPSWRRSVIPPGRQSGEPEQSCWLVFADECGLGARLVKELEAGGQDVIVVRAGAELTEEEGGYTLNPGRLEDYDALLGELKVRGRVPQEIVHLWSVTREGKGEAWLERLDGVQGLGFYSLLYLAQALGRQNVTESIQITVVSEGVQEVTGGEALCAEKATLLGPVTILPHEYPNVRCRSVDVVLSEAEGDRVEGQILAEIEAETTDPIVAYRGPHRWVQTYEKVQLEKPDTVPQLREGGVYLITGGLGGVGFTLARHLAERVGARLVLVGRTAIPVRKGRERWVSTHGEEDPISRKIRRVEALEALGCEVLVASANVAELRQMQSVVSEALERFGRIDGVIHAAGVPGGGMMQLETRARAERVMASKVRGTLSLVEALEGVSLDWLVLCSSVNAVVGRVGQVDYCAANAFLDVFAHGRAHGGGKPVICIGWDTWREVGMAAEALEGTVAAPDETQRREVGHPLLDECIYEDEGQSVYVTRFAVGEQWELHEHGILGRPTLPGTAYLEMARAAFEDRVGDGAVEIGDAYFPGPLILEGEEERRVHTVLKREGGGFTFSIVSERGGGWQEHARGRIAALEAGATRKYDIGELEARCGGQHVANPLEEARLGHFDLERRVISREVSGGEPLEVDSIVIAEGGASTQRGSMEFGPRWHSLRRVDLGEREGLGSFELGEAFGEELQVYGLHPALLDFATSFLRLFRSEGSYLPLSYKRLRVVMPLPGRVYSHVRFIDEGSSPGVTLRFDVALMDEEGRGLVEIDEFAVIRVDDAAKLEAPSASFEASQFPWVGGDDASTALLREDLREGLSPAEGVEAFERILASGLPQVVVSPRDLLERIERSRSETLLSQVSGAVQKPKHPRPKLMTAYAAPRGKVERELAEIWQDVLGIEPVGVHDNFFDLGGDSLLVTRIHTRFVERFEQDVSVASLLQYPTIEDLSRFLSEQAREGEPSFEDVHEHVGQQKAALKRLKQKMRQKRAVDWTD